MSEFVVRPAVPGDVPAIHQLIRGLAEYERLADQAVATEEDIRRSVFGDPARAEVLMGMEGSEAVGFALYFHNYSTFLGRHGVYLEDLFVRPHARGRGYGRRLLATLAAIARERGCTRLEWSVLDWNEPAIRFYRSLGANAMDQWTVYRLTGAALDALAEEGARDGWPGAWPAGRG
jgi:GNAT superfamily N-acetyltransferase